MGIVESLAHGGKLAARRQLFVMLMVAQSLGFTTSWAQDTTQPRFDKELTKQEKIYGSKGDDVPPGYITNRGLSGYAELLPTGFCAALGKLGSSDRWLDIGAGDGQAILDYYAADDQMAEAQKCGRSTAKARAVAMSIEDRRTDKWHKSATTLGNDHIRYLSGKRLRQYSFEELGKFQIITDVFGGFTYTEDLSRFIDKVLRLLEVGGGFYTLLPGVHLDNGKEKLGILFLTELEDGIGRPEKVCSWLKKITCAQVICESQGDWKRPTELINIRKTCSDTAVPRMKLIEFEAGYPPTRRFQMSQ